MKRLPALFLALVLTLALAGCSPARDPNNYYIGETDSGWCILYPDEGGGEPEEIAVMGTSPQPLVMIRGRFYFVQPGKIVSVNGDGKDRRELAVPDMPEGSRIARADEESLCCISENTATSCWCADAGLTKAEKMTIPRKFRMVDYSAFQTLLEEETGAVDNDIRVTGARAELDSNGSLVHLELEMLVFTGDVGSMHVWNHVDADVTMHMNEPKIELVDRNFPLSLASNTTSKDLTAQEFLTALQTIDTAEVAAHRQSGTPDAFLLTYGDEDLEAAAQDAPVLSAAGEKAERDSAGCCFILSQIGGTEAQVTDKKGVPCGNLLLLQLD